MKLLLIGKKTNPINFLFNYRSSENVLCRRRSLEWRIHIAKIYAHFDKNIAIIVAENCVPCNNYYRGGAIETFTPGIDSIIGSR